VECHGTATPLGDPIEFAALAQAFPKNNGAAAYCALGSVKGNVGHLDIAAGMSGLIKAALAVRHGKIPATLHFSVPNPHIPFAGSAFYVNAELRDWPAGDEPRRAGVSAFGVGGTNVHLVLEERPIPLPHPIHAAAQLLVVSARSEAAVHAARARLGAHLRATPDADLADVAFTLQAGRRAFPFRAALTASTARQAADTLDDAGKAAIRKTPVSAPAVAFMFAGQGAQYVGMGRGLYDQVPVFRATIDRCAEVLRPILGQDLRDILYPPEGRRDSSLELTATAFAQPAIFSVEYALAQVWLSWGIAPASMIGHSVGEFVAATIAGVFAPDDALALVAQRGRLMQALPGGAMLAVHLSSAELLPLLSEPLGLAASNSATLSVAAGPYAAIEQLEHALTGRDVAFRRLDTSHAFHSPMMDPIVDPLIERIARLRLEPPKIAYVSGVTGEWMTAADAVSPEYWARHCRAPVQFAAGLDTLLAGGATALLEVSPGTVLTTFAKQRTRKSSDVTSAGSLPGPNSERDDHATMLASLGLLWTAGAQPNWAAVHAPARPRRTSLPTYPFERARHWIERAPIALAAAPQPLQLAASPRALAIGATTQSTEMENIVNHPSPGSAASNDARREAIQCEIIQLLEDLSGETISAGDCATTFLELGFDSLFLGRFVQRLGARFAVNVTFRSLLNDLPTIVAVTERVLKSLPLEPAAFAAPAAALVSSSTPQPLSQIPPAAVSGVAAPASAVRGASASAAAGSCGSPIESVVRDQLATMQLLMRDQLQALQGLNAGPPAPTGVAPARYVAPDLPAAATQSPAVASAPSRFEVFGPGSTASRTEFTRPQHDHIDDLIARTTARTGRSKELTQRHRGVLADPRVAAGFRSEWKEMVYPIACERAKGSRLWDIDGNEYIDLLNGFGQTAFGHSPDFVVDALEKQIRLGFPIGPQTTLAGEVAELFCELTGNERVTFCNTGSEAVMAALRLARTVTGRNRVVVFSGAYHGQFDEVLIKGARTSQRALPVAPGIPLESVANMVVLPYAEPASLEWVREHAAELAAVVVEPVQSRHPDLQPRAFLTEVRAITAASGTALVFDEVVTGFRVHPGGMQHVFGIRADLATYGKVAGGGMPIGILAGKARYMDALDGGMWQYGDDSMPEIAPTFFAGTFVRHPLTMSAVLAVLRHLKEHGPALQATLATRTADMVGRLNADLARRGIAGHIETFSSLFYFNFIALERLSSLLYYHLRLRGVYIQEGFPCFMTTAHTAADVEHIVSAFSASLDELQTVGIFARSGSAAIAAPASGASAAAAALEIPLTEEQTEIWLAAQLSDAASCAFNESMTLRFAGTVDERAFAAAWNTVLARHDALRAAFAPTGETMRITPLAEFHYAVTDVSARTPAEAEAELAAATALDAATAFDLIAGPLVRGHLLHLGPAANAFIFTAHHIICDGWSMNVILNEFAAVYTAACNGTTAQLDPALQFSDYARSERDPAELAKVEAYWLAAFADAVPALDLPADRPRPLMKSFRGSTRSTRIDAGAYRAIKKAGARHGCTLFVTLLTGFNVLVGRLAQTHDVVVGVPAAGQSLLDNQILVGHCVDFLPIRLRWNAQSRFSDLLGSMKTSVLDAYEHQDYTLGTLVRKLGLPRQTSRLPLAEIQFNLERMPGELALPGAAVNLTPNAKAFVNFDLFLNVIEAEDGLRLDCDYNTDLFNPATIDGWLNEYRAILDALVADAEAPASPRPADTAEHDRALSLCIDTAVPYPHAATLISLIADQAARRPHALAAVCGAESLTYEMLDRRANALAHHLLNRVGANEARVGIGVARSLDMLVALLATCKAGYAYVPLDPTHPPARLRHILRDAQVAAMIIDGAAPFEMLPDGIPLIHLERDADTIAACAQSAPAVTIDSDRLAYVIYTSGSTGAPKGVEITHRALVNFLCSMAREPGFGPADSLVAVTTVSFDIAALELFVPLTVGGRVTIATDAQVRDGFALQKLLSTSRATVMQATPSTWRMLLEVDFRSPRGFKMLCGGEALQRDLADRLLDADGELWNMYGPTETTIWSACTRIVRDTAITVGRPIANTQFAVLDPADELVPLGQTGQLHIGGDGVARGYVQRPDLTAEKFISNPFGPGRMYRTGDQARMLPGGSVESLGRLDDQIKLRGFRIELGEIESTLTSHGALAASAIAVHDDAAGQPRLVAYYVERSGAPTTADALRAIATQHLPEYMIPTAWMRLDALPLNTNGKLDRGALPTPNPELEHTVAFHAPTTPTEITLAKIWADVLKRERIGTDDDIFALGADSIQIFQITARANRQGVPILAKHLMKQRTLGNAAAYIDDAGPAVGSSARNVLPASGHVIRAR
jgi:amino acid adenylation domain-containing protein